MKYKNITDNNLLIRIIEGETDPTEVRLFNEWLGQSENNQREFESLKLVWERTDSYKVPDIPNPDLMWNNISEKINKSPDIIKEGFDFSWIMKTAAVILFAVTGIIFYNHITESTSSRNNHNIVSDNS